MNKSFNIQFLSSTCTSVQVGRQSYLILDKGNERYEIWFTHITNDDESKNTIYCIDKPQYFEFRIVFNGCILVDDKFKQLRAVWLMLNRQKFFAKKVTGKTIQDIINIIENTAI